MLMFYEHAILPTWVNPALILIFSGYADPCVTPVVLRTPSQPFRLLRWSESPVALRSSSWIAMDLLPALSLRSWLVRDSAQYLLLQVNQSAQGRRILNFKHVLNLQFKLFSDLGFVWVTVLVYRWLWWTRWVGSVQAADQALSHCSECTCPQASHWYP